MGVNRQPIGGKSVINITKKIQNLLDFLPEEAENLQLCGIDEAGRGPLAGPLVVAGVILEQRINGLGDSKALTEEKREMLYPKILERSRYHLVTIEAEEIDGEGLSRCMRAALEEIVDRLGSDDVRFLFDGNSSFGVSGIATLVKADGKVPQVGAASILAKVTRDRIMVEHDRRWPEYGFARHKGYGTAEHLEAIRRHGLCPIHRRSFRNGTEREPERPSLF
jgi:ribonuclease HII